ncbi:hypothetical protein GQ55_3G156000 [Panicum hallii var. hallii]|uniref:Uncharacterized protein n=1 Tax=Panicum hallii var. hallii TaxID=1504633 RepID=A0A2T7E9W9_9POAL|nr:hypothetical protein GQ55_3G156000 [Panicum hallii var. hallii]
MHANSVHFLRRQTTGFAIALLDPRSSGSKTPSRLLDLSQVSYGRRTKRRNAPRKEKLKRKGPPDLKNRSSRALGEGMNTEQVQQGEPLLYVLCTGCFPPLRQLYSTTARAQAKAWSAPQCAPAPAMVRDSSRWNRVCFAMNASTVRRNSSASSMPQHACASRAVTDDRRRRPFSDSERRSSGDTARRARRGPIFSDLLRLGARASLLARTEGWSSNAVPARAVSGAAGAAAASGASVAAGAGTAGVAKEAASSKKLPEGVGAGVAKEGKLALAAGAACGGGGFAAVALAVLVCWLEETERSCLDSATSSSTMALPRTKTKRALRRSDPARRRTAAAADGTRDDDQERKATSARSSPTRSIRYRRRSRSAAPAAAMAVWHRALEPVGCKDPRCLAPAGWLPRGGVPGALAPLGFLERKLKVRSGRVEGAERVCELLLLLEILWLE